MPGILDELGLEPDYLDWHDLALCKNIDITGPDNDYFYDAYESDEEIAIAADSLCMSCPVIKQCFFAGQDGQYGVWGGVYWNGTGRPDVNRNSHKTPEIWDKVRGLVSG